MKTTIRFTSIAACVVLLLALPANAQKIASFHLSGPVIEKPLPDMMGLGFASQKMVSLKDLLERFKQARDDDEVRAVLLTWEGVSMGLAQVQELRDGIAQIRAADKEVFVQAEELSNLTYALAAAGSHINIVPTGDLWLTGIYAEAPYAKGLLDKLHIDADFLHIGAYKSAAETLTRTGPSEPAEENMNWLIDGLYESLVDMVADGRRLSAEKAKALIDDGPYTASRALEAGLIDSVEYRQEFLTKLKERYDDGKIVKNYGEDTGPDVPGDFFSMVTFFMDMIHGTGDKDTTPAVGIVYVDGAISTGTEEHSPFGGSSGAKSTSIRKALEQAARDDAIKAVVLRVDSPGGSALASEIIWHATQRVAEKKPLIVSMGNVAGSGGYYVSCGGDAIFADEATITASIGVVGGKLVTTGMWQECLGINWHEYKRGNSSAIMSTSHRFSDDERARVHRWMNDVYVVFKSRIEAGRGDKLAKPLEEMAGGRVFTGKQALALGLIDRLGGLDDAIKYAAAQAELGDYDIRVVPKTKNFFEMLMEDFGGSDDDEFASTSISKPLFSADSPMLRDVLPILNRLDPVRMRAVLQTLQRLELIHTEGVITMMPEEIVIR